MKNFLRGKRSRDLRRLDEDSLITKNFCSDGMMQYDYSCFGDVVSLDTNFRTNKEYFPLAAFLGFSHHRQSGISVMPCFVIKRAKCLSGFYMSSCNVWGVKD
ncbi:hypothetical protein LIER_18083 [Lithospermum erythrorhizon]|uniref:Uncharacterized protein n=1 Tax=Lithospermum erythrorhizon TaxID=34254 RepID=A0AAV3QFA1_LITER